MSSNPISPVIQINTSNPPTIMWNGNAPGDGNDNQLSVFFLPTSGNVSLQVYFWPEGATMFDDGYNPPEGNQDGYVYMNLSISDYQQFMIFVTTSPAPIYAIYEGVVTQQTHVMNADFNQNMARLTNKKKTKAAAS